ncbi:MAG TPA: hypothetical protein VL970_15685 [Candidatus Acidoferrales bacterium]|nr:hypothetical protein [Candidatus Acidoferrales bacterium]
MKTAIGRIHITDDMGNDVVTSSQFDAEFAALSAVAEAAEEEHRAHCLLLTNNCPLCRALAELDEVRNEQRQAHRN